MWNLVTEGMSTIADSASDEEKAAHKELKKRDFKALFIIHQCVDPDNFEKVGDCESAKEAWDILAQSFGGAEKVKEALVQKMFFKSVKNDFLSQVRASLNNS
jgi:hypothetical protein